MIHNSKKIMATFFVAIFFTIYGCDNPGEQASVEPPQSDFNGTNQQQIVIEQQKIAEEKRIAEQKEEEQKLIYKNSITNILQEAKDFARIHKDYYERVTFLRNVNLTQTPSDFSVAFVDNMHAWIHYMEIDNALSQLHEDGNVGTILLGEGLSRMLDLESHPLSDAADTENRLNAAANEANLEIKKTYETLERIAVSYGASLPH